MRIIPVFLLIAAAGIATASAQHASADERANEDAAASSAGAAAASNNAAAAASNQSAAGAAGVRRSPSEFTDFHVNGGGTIPAPPPRTPEQQKADAEAHAAWQARCRPTVVADREGLRRTKYAEPDCDLLRIKTAGTR
jgi:hypothetical protein